MTFAWWLYLYLLFIYLSILPACVSARVYACALHVCRRSLGRGEDTDSPGTGTYRRL